MAYHVPMEPSYRSVRWTVTHRRVGFGMWETEVREPLRDGFVLERHRWREPWRSRADRIAELVGMAFGWLFVCLAWVMVTAGVALISIGIGLLCGEIR